MQWEQLTAADLAKAADETGVCIIALGVVERHSNHLPLGTDYLVGHKVACLAAAREPAVVFPPFYFGQIYEARCFPGAITLRPEVLLGVIQGVFDEIGRNGFGKIIAYNAHGGNTHLLHFLAQASLWKQKPYSLYIPTRSLTPEGEAEWQRLRKGDFGGHAGESETCMVLGTYPELVQRERIPDTPARPLGRLRKLPPTYAGIAWYADYPEHYQGDAHYATRKNGERLIEMCVDALASYIAAVKADDVVPALEEEFFGRQQGRDASPPQHRPI